MRTFVAFLPPPGVAERLHAALAPLRAAAPGARWLPAASWHCTVRFLGELGDARAAAVAGALDTAARAVAPIPVSLGGLGAFPSWRRARAVWLGVTADPKLELLHHDVETGLNALGFEVEGRVFRPHVTIARIDEGPGAAAVRVAVRSAARAMSGTARQGLRASMTVTHLHLMRSVAGPSGGRYEPVHAAPLGRAA